jgi:phage terminase small subunit
MAGRPARPAALKLLNGRTADTDSGGRKVEAPVALARSAPEPPEWLDAEAAAEWDRIVPELARMRLLATIGRSTIAAYCTTWSQYVEMVELYRLNRAAPREMMALSKELRMWATQYGLTPSSEGSLHPPELPDVDDPFA